MNALLAGLVVAVATPFVFLIGIAVWALIALILAFPLQWAWNCAIPSLFSLQALTYWQAFSLLIIAQLLIKSTSNCSSSKS